ncbi:general substrate transporter [Microdochium trichocladiopsis]|uniref:General substrate transporter n=1 Tax=Microdochium trichocladiopsis TaxID=1682393 RepID=A0A9P9BVC1_9PEZI|nr:general substrate transporter [Microdochium trichocladiopsis]KAH7039567.1 general substrate transporter [Microdochium trichocladiopsis]
MADSKPVAASLAVKSAEKQPDVDHVDLVKAESGDDEVPPVISAFAELTRNQAMWKFKRLYLNGLLVCVAALYAGYANSVVGSIVANQGFIDYFGSTRDPATGKLALNPQYVSLWGAIYSIAQILIQVMAPWASDRFGRKLCMWLISLFIVISIIIQVVSTQWYHILIARFIAGFAGGMMGTAVMVYMSEISLPQFRGALLGAFSLGFALGQVFLAVAFKILADYNPMAFRNAFYSEFVFTSLWLLVMLWLPESPAWYASKGRDEEGKKALRRLVGGVDGYDIDHEFAVIRYDFEQSQAKRKATQSDWGAIFKNKTNLQRAFVSAIPFTLQNIVGVPLMFGYTTYFFQLAGVADPFLGNMVKQLVLVVGIIVSFYTVDIVGRRPLVLYGTLAMAVLTFLVGCLSFVTMTAASGAALVALCCLWAFVYANTLAPIGWLSLVEISSPSVRAKTTSIAVTVQYLTGILFNYTVPLMLSNQYAGWGTKIGFFFAGLSGLMLVPIIFFYPETKGRTYAEIDELYQRGIPAWRFNATKTHAQEEIEALRGVGTLAQ